MSALTKLQSCSTATKTICNNTLHDSTNMGEMQEKTLFGLQHGTKTKTQNFPAQFTRAINGGATLRQPLKSKEMKANKIVFLHYPCRIVVAESCDTPNSYDPERHDQREYARIIPTTEAIGGIWLTRFEFAGTIEWTKHAGMLTDEQRAQIESCAARYAERDAEKTKRAKELQAYQRVKYADKIAKYGEDNA